MRGVPLKQHPVLVVTILVLFALVAGTNGCTLFESEQVAKGRKLYRHYCMHCHGESGRQNEGFNWVTMPDPRPRDLSEEAAMSTFSDEEIFHTISREMKDTTDQAVLDDEDYFAVPTMPTFKYTLSEDEIWSVVSFVRSLHGMSLSYDVDGRKKKLEEAFQVAQQEFDQATQALEAVEAKLEEAEAAAEEAEETEEDIEGDEDADLEEDEEEIVLPEEIALEEAEEKFEDEKTALENFTKRPRQGQISRPDLTVSDTERGRLEQVGKHLYENQYGCNACHSLNNIGGLVGPELDRAGFRLNEAWIYRWIRYPQGMKKKTRMPNLGINEEDAKALTLYLKTLRAPKPDDPIPPPN